MNANTTRQTFSIDLADVTTAAQLHDTLASSLPLPQHYGRNLDAFYDVLTEFGTGWKIIFHHAGPAAAALRSVCADAMLDTPSLEIIFLD